MTFLERAKRYARKSKDKKIMKILEYAREYPTY